MTTDPSIFISYAHEDADIARRFATALEAEGARVWIDQGELLIGDSLIERISEAIAEFDFVAALVSPASVESNWCRKEIALGVSKQLKRGSRRVTILPIRVGDTEMPASLSDVKWLQMSADDPEVCAAEVARSATAHLEQQSGSSVKPAPAEPTSGSGREGVDDEPIRITGVDTEGVSEPLGDGTQGSALYRVPLTLNRTPDPFWSEHFREAWDHPPAWTSMHRPGIGSVVGDRIFLHGTTIDELERYHLKTLKLVVKQLNEMTAAHDAQVRAQAAAEAKAREQHRKQIEDVSARLSFD